MARRPRTTLIEPDIMDPLDDAVMADKEETATDLAGVLEQMRGYDTGDIKGVLYKVPRGGGKFEWIEEVIPPFKPNEIMETCKERFGGGDFQLRIFAGGKIRKNVNFSIAQDRAPLVAPKGESNDLVALLIQQSERGKSDMLQMMTMMMQQQTAASERAMSMQANQTQMMVGMMTAIMGGQAKPTDLLPLIAAMREGKAEGGGLSDTLELLKTAKGLFAGGEGGGGLDADDLVGSALKLAGPVVGALGRAVQSRQEATQAVQVQAMDYTAQPGPLQLPGAAPNPVPVEQPATTHPVIELVRADVLFMYGRGYDPELAAEAVFDRLDAAGVDEGAISELVAQITASGQPWEALAAYGLDFRGNLAWGERFFATLVQLHANPGGADDAAPGRGGDGADLAADGAPGAGGIAAH